MLRQRIITALVLLAILLPATFYPSALPFGLVTLVLLACGAWEWARLNGFSFRAALRSGAVCALLCSAAWYLGLPTARLSLFWTVMGGFWVLAGAWTLRSGVQAWQALPKTLRLAAGVVLLWAACRCLSRVLWHVLRNSV